nr:MAG TPA: hypothetical protein [Caudoviricetes sp.]
MALKYVMANKQVLPLTNYLLNRNIYIFPKFFKESYGNVHVKQSLQDGGQHNLNSLDYSVFSGAKALTTGTAISIEVGIDKLIPQGEGLPPYHMMYPAKSLPYERIYYMYDDSKYIINKATISASLNNYYLINDKVKNVKKIIDIFIQNVQYEETLSKNSLDIVIIYLSKK